MLQVLAYKTLMLLLLNMQLMRMLRDEWRTAGVLETTRAVNVELNRNTRNR